MTNEELAALRALWQRWGNAPAISGATIAGLIERGDIAEARAAQLQAQLDALTQPTPPPPDPPPTLAWRDQCRADWERTYAQKSYASLMAMQSGKVVYIDLNAASDGTGTWQSPRNRMPPLFGGESYLFKPGNVFRGTLRVPAGVLIGTYDPASGGRIIDKNRPLAVFDSAGANKCIDAPVSSVTLSGVKLTTSGTYAAGGTFGFYSCPQSGGNGHIIEHCDFDGLRPAVDKQGISGGIYVWGRDVTVRSNRFRRSPLDCVYIARSVGGVGPDGLDVYGNDIELEQGIVTDGPDCVQIHSGGGTFGKVRVRDNFLRHRSNVKQCVVLSGNSASGDLADISDNVALGPVQTEPFPLNDPIRKGKTIYSECMNTIVTRNKIDSGVWAIGLYGAGSKAVRNVMVFDAPGKVIDLGVIAQAPRIAIDKNRFIVLAGTLVEGVEHYLATATGVTITGNRFEVRGGTLDIPVRRNPGGSTESGTVVERNSTRTDFEFLPE